MSKKSRSPGRPLSFSERLLNYLNQNHGCAPTINQARQLRKKHHLTQPQLDAMLSAFSTLNEPWS